MPRFFFDVQDGKGFVDDVGSECVDLSGARQEAVRFAGEILCDMAQLWNGRAWQMKVRDEAGEVVTTLEFSCT